MISSPAWPGGVQEPSAGDWADVVSHLCFPPPVLGHVEPCKWDSSPKVCSVPAWRSEDQEDNWKRMLFLRVYITSWQSTLYTRSQFHRADIQSLQWDWRRRLILCSVGSIVSAWAVGEPWSRYFCPSAPSAFKKPLKPYAVFDSHSTLPGASHHIPSVQRRLSGTLVLPESPKNMQDANLLNEILWIVCSTPSFPMDAAYHAPGVSVLHVLCIVHFGWTCKDFGEDKDMGQKPACSIFSRKQGETFCSWGHLRFMGKKPDLFITKILVPRSESRNPPWFWPLNPDLYQSLRQVRSWWDPGRADVTAGYCCPMQILAFRTSHAILACSTTHCAPPFRHAGPQMKEKGDVRNQSDAVYISAGSPASGLDPEVRQPYSGRGNNLILQENMLWFSHFMNLRSF